MAEKKKEPSSSKVTHGMADFPKEVDKKQVIRKVCIVCKTRGVRKLTRKTCMRCFDKPGMCSAEHFESYHKKKKK